MAKFARKFSKFIPRYKRCSYAGKRSTHVKKVQLTFTEVSEDKMARSEKAIRIKQAYDSLYNFLSCLVIFGSKLRDVHTSFADRLCTDLSAHMDGEISDYECDALFFRFWSFVRAIESEYDLHIAPAEVIHYLGCMKDWCRVYLYVKFEDEIPPCPNDFGFWSEEEMKQKNKYGFLSSLF